MLLDRQTQPHKCKNRGMAVLLLLLLARTLYNEMINRLSVCHTRVLYQNSYS